MLNSPYQRLNTEVDHPDPIKQWNKDGARVIYILDDNERAPAQAVIPCRLLDERLAAQSFCLGLDDAGPLLLLTERDATIDKTIVEKFYIEGIRKLSSHDPINIDPLLHAHGLMNWHNSHQYCDNCGQTTKPNQGGLSQVCSGCGRIHFPRTDPCVIVRVERGDAICLGGQKIWPEKQRSVLAGFIETGESAEQCIIREIKEESNLDVYAIRYLKSQSWPFPRSLMFAFSAQNDSGEFSSINDEILNLQWYDPNQLTQAVQNKDILLPMAKSVAYWLIDEWFQTKTQTPLASI